MSYQNILYRVEGGICTITINRPEKMNALNKMVFDELDDTMNRVYTDRTIRSVVITGEGNKAFVAGADIGEFKDIPAGEGTALSRRGQLVFDKIEQCPKPVVAAVNGFALGGGCELAMACHFRYASINARFGQPEVSLGLIPGYGGTQRLATLIGKGRAMELILSGKIISAEMAMSYGLVNEVCHPDDLISKVKDVLKLMMEKSPLAIGRAIEAINRFNDIHRGLIRESELFGSCFDSEDGREGAAAFLEKRKPKFRGK